MEKWTEIRRRVLNHEISKRAASAEYGIHWETLQKILTHSEPPGYRLTKRRASKLEPFLPIIKEILRSDRQVHRKQQHTAKRIFERLRDEHGFDGGYTIVKDAVRTLKQQNREVFLPLSHPPGEASSHRQQLLTAHTAVGGKDRCVECGITSEFRRCNQREFEPDEIAGGVTTDAHSGRSLVER